MKQIFLLLILGLVVPLLWLAPASAAESAAAPAAVGQSRQANAEDENVEVMRAFTSQEEKVSAVVSIEDDTKRLIMFLMGVPLLILLIATTALGVAMGVYGKPVFLPHMICAGLSVTLAMAHAVVGIVWFYPF